jgi:hypothetical protein
VVNGRNLGTVLPRDSILSAVRARGGAILAFDAPGHATIHR